MKESRFNVWVEREGGFYCFNGLSGALLRVAAEDYQPVKQFLAGDESARVRPMVLAELARGRMAVPDDSDELELLALRYKSSRYDTSMFALTIVTSLGCNFDCPYCFEAKHPSIMSPQVEQAVLKLLDDKLPTMGAFHVSWFGGEPLVGKRPLLALSDAFIERCDRAEVGYSASITTNGYLLDEATCRQLRDRRVGSTQVCLDGPPEIHDRMRPLAGGQGSFWRIVENLHHAVEYLPVSVRINADHDNIGHAEELLQILEREGFSGKFQVYVGQIVATGDNPFSPSASYGNHARCFTSREYAEAELAFQELAARYGFHTPALLKPTGAPCTAVRANELVVGSKGELYKCWDSVGNWLEVIGDIRHYEEPNGRLQKWLKYDPFADPECQSCIALPVCMGGCAHHAMEPAQYDNRCDTFRHTYQQQVLRFVEYAERNGGATFTAPKELAHAMDRQ